MEPGALDVLIVWVTVLASASWRQAGSLALVTLLVGVGLTSLVTCVGENVVQEDGGWVEFASVQICPEALACAWVPSQHLWWSLVTQCPPAAHLLPASPQACCLLQTIQIPFNHLLSS